MVWFRDPRDDPRLRNGFPVNRSDVRRLTEAEFKEGLRKNRAHPQNPVMIIRKRSPGFPRRRARKNPFFDKAFGSFVSGAKAAEADDSAERLVTAQVDWQSRVFRQIAGLDVQTARLRKTLRLKL